MLQAKAFTEGMRFKEKLSKLMEPRGTAASVARKTGIPTGNLSEFKNSESTRMPTVKQLVSIAKALGVPIDYLADDEQDDPPSPELTADEREILRQVRRFNLSVDDAIRALAREYAKQSDPNSRFDDGTLETQAAEMNARQRRA